MYKIVVLFAVLAAAHAGLIGLQAPILKAAPLILPAPVKIETPLLVKTVKAAPIVEQKPIVTRTYINKAPLVVPKLISAPILDKGLDWPTADIGLKGWI